MLEVKELLRKSYEKIIMQKIREKGGHVENPEEIWDNLTYLAQEVQKFGETRLFLPLQVKKMLAYIVDPDNYVEYQVNSDENSCTVEARLYWTGSSYPSGVGFVKRYVNQIFPNNSMSPEERLSIMESTVRGLALSRAITDAGIGMHLYGDCFDFNVEALEKDEAEKEINKEAEKKVPNIPSAEEKKVQRLAAKAAKEKAERKPQEEMTEAMDAAVAVPVEVPKVTAVAEDNTLHDEKEPEKDEVYVSSMSIEEARKAVADKGALAGNTLGVIFDKKPLNLIWLINNHSAVSDAAMALVESDDELKKKL